MILYRIVKNLLRRGHGADLVQFTHSMFNTTSYLFLLYGIKFESQTLLQLQKFIKVIYVQHYQFFRTVLKSSRLFTIYSKLFVSV